MTTKSSRSARLIDIIPDMCFVVTGEMTLVDCNAKAREALGLPRTLDGSLHFQSLLTEDSPPLPLEALRANGRAVEADARIKRQWGKPIDTQLFITGTNSGGKQLTYIVARDVSETREKELDLLRFSNVVHYTVNPIQITDADGKMIYVNPAFERVTGFTKEELIGRYPNIISSGKYSEDFWTRAWSVIRAGRVWTGEIENRRKDGQPIFTHLLISPIIGTDGTVVGYLGAHRDLTEQRALEQQLIHSQKMESIGTLAAGIAHEVGNPLASISSIVQVLMRTLGDDAARDRLGLVQAQVHRITKIIRDLVDFSRPSNFKVQPTDLIRVLTDAVEIVKMGKKAKSITFVTHVRCPVPSLMLVPDQISQVFINILLNAVDALQGKEGMIASTVERENGSLRVTITDDGHGIAPEHLPKIFEPFFTTKSVGQGTGLGLWVSYGIMKSFRGDLLVRSTPGTGTSFTVVLPVNAREHENG